MSLFSGEVYAPAASVVMMARTRTFGLIPFGSRTRTTTISSATVAELARLAFLLLGFLFFGTFTRPRLRLFSGARYRYGARNL